MAMKLEGKAAVVTGASAGIGRATAKALARRGVRVALVGRSESRLRELAHELQRLGSGAGPAALPVVADITDPAAVEAMAARVQAELGPVDVLVNNAGIALWGPFAAMTTAEIHAEMQANFFGSVYCTRAFLPSMLERRSGSIAFVSSGLGILPFPGASMYCASKHAVNGFAGSLRAEVEPLGVHVLLAMPGVTGTELFASAAEGAHAAQARYLFQPTAKPERVAERLVRAIERQRRRELFRTFNDVGLRFASVFTGIQDAYLVMVGRRLRRQFGWSGAGVAAGSPER